MSRAGRLIFSPESTSVMLRSEIATDTARLIWPLKRRMERCRLTALLFLPSSLLSIICGTTALRSAGFADAQVPFRQQTHLLLGIALVHHAPDKVLVFLHVVAGRFR